MNKTEANARVVNAAKRWWRMHRPIGWDLKTHRANACINVCTDTEANLARAVAAFIRVEERLGKKPKKGSR